MMNLCHVNLIPHFLEEVDGIPGSKLPPVLVERNCFGADVLLNDKLIFVHFKRWKVIHIDVCILVFLVCFGSDPVDLCSTFGS